MRVSYVCGFMIDQDSVLLIRKMRPAWQAGRLNGVGGKVEAGETPVNAMVREFREETGLETTIDDWRHFACLKGAFGQVDFFVAFGDTRRAVATTDETPERVSLDPLPDDVIANLRWLIPMALDTGIAGPVLVNAAA